MDPVWDDGSELIERSGRLLLLTQSLNLEDLDGKCSRLSPCYAFVQDFLRLRRHLRERERLACVYGLDSPCGLDCESLLPKMRVLTSQLFAHVEAAAAAYCTLKSHLCLEANDFFDEICSKLDSRVQKCTSEEERSRLLLAVFRLKNVYEVYLY